MKKNQSILLLENHYVMSNTNWKEVLYEKYVTSGQAKPSVSHQQLLAFKERQVKYFIERFIPKKKSSIILDLGCGYGVYVYFLQKKVFLC